MALTANTTKLETYSNGIGGTTHAYTEDSAKGAVLVLISALAPHPIGSFAPSMAMQGERDREQASLSQADGVAERLPAAEERN